MRVKIRGVVYETVAEASKAVGVSEKQVRKAVSLMREDFLGTGTGRKVTVRIRGVTYPSVAQAAAALGVSASHVSKAMATDRLETVGNGPGKAKRRLDNQGGVPPHPVTLAGIDFPSKSHASRALGFTDRHVGRILAEGSPAARARLQRAAEEYRDRKLAELLDRQAARDRAIRAERLECHPKTGRELL